MSLGVQNFISSSQNSIPPKLISQPSLSRHFPGHSPAPNFPPIEPRVKTVIGQIVPRFPAGNDVVAVVVIPAAGVGLGESPEVLVILRHISISAPFGTLKQPARINPNYGVRRCPPPLHSPFSPGYTSFSDDHLSTASLSTPSDNAAEGNTLATFFAPAIQNPTQYRTNTRDDLILRRRFRVSL